MNLIPVDRATGESAAPEDDVSVFAKAMGACFPARSVSPARREAPAAGWVETTARSGRHRTRTEPCQKPAAAGAAPGSARRAYGRSRTRTRTAGGIEHAEETVRSAWIAGDSSMSSSFARTRNNTVPDSPARSEPNS